MSKTAILAVRIIGDAKGATQATQATSAAMDKMKIVAAAAAAAIGVMTKKAIDNAGDLEQSTGAVEAVFKDHADAVKGWASEAATSLGITRNEYQELGTLIGSQLKNAGVAMDELGPKTNELIGLGGDLAAMFGGTTREAVESISSALKGERDPIEKYGVSLKQAGIDAKAAELGFKKVGGAFDQEAQAAATLALIMEQTGDAHGAFARETDTYATRVQILKAQIGDLSAAYGQLLLPAATAVVGYISEQMIPALQRLVDAAALLQDGASTTDIVAALGLSDTSPIGAAVAGIVDWLRGLGDTISNLTGGQIGGLVAVIAGLVLRFTPLSGMLAGFAGALAGLLTPVNLIIGGLAALYLGSETFRDSVNDLAGVLGGVIGDLATQLGPIVADLATQLGPVLSGILGGLGDALAGLLDQIAPVVSELAGTLGPALAELASTALPPLLDALTTLAPVIGEVLGTALSAIGDIITTLAPVIGELASALAPLIGQFVEQLAPVLTDLASELLPVVSQLLQGLAPVVSELLTAIAPLVTELIDALAPVLEQLAPLVTELIDALTPVAESVVPTVISVISALVPIVAALAQRFITIVEVLASLLVPALQIVVGAVQVVAGVLTGDWAMAWEGAKGIVTGAVDLIKNLVVGLVRLFIAEARLLLTPIADALRNGWQRGVDATRTGIARVLDFVTGLPGRITSGLAHIGSVMAGIGRDLIDGLTGGIQDMAQRAVDAVSGVVGDAITSAKNLLGIASPSRVFATIGNQTAAGYIKGITGMTGRVQSAMADMIAPPTPAAIKLPAVTTPATRQGQAAATSGPTVVFEPGAITVTGAFDPEETGRQLVDTLDVFFRRRGIAWRPA
ncbi:phage tail protein [Brevibacterium otitidis]|uniref:Phage-related protein n=1 Tax=Brevibacterium otitidis TaxID=53364 RepID=A0ABV5WYZ9_9MICO|nr:hypothetical protein GCM10023233_25880 [Brevibacterium otitidis]